MQSIDEEQLRDKTLELVQLKDALRRSESNHPGVLAAVALRTARACLTRLFWQDVSAFSLRRSVSGAVMVDDKPLDLPRPAVTLLKEESLDPDDYMEVIWSELPEAVAQALRIILEPAQKLDAKAEMVDEGLARVEILYRDGERGGELGHKKVRPRSSE